MKPFVRSALLAVGMSVSAIAFGAVMARSGVRLPVLQRMMGHVDPSTTLRYIHLSLADVAKEYDRAVRRIAKQYERS